MALGGHGQGTHLFIELRESHVDARLLRTPPAVRFRQAGVLEADDHNILLNGTSGSRIGCTGSCILARRMLEYCAPIFLSSFLLPFLCEVITPLAQIYCTITKAPQSAHFSFRISDLLKAEGVILGAED